MGRLSQGGGEEAAPGSEAPTEPAAVTDDDVKAVSAETTFDLAAAVQFLFP